MGFGRQVGNGVPCWQIFRWTFRRLMRQREEEGTQQENENDLKFSQILIKTGKWA